MGVIVHQLVEKYLDNLRGPADETIDELARQGRRNGLPVVPEQTGRLLHALALATGAKRILEVGTSIGYSTAWLARAMPPDGLLISIERDAERAAAARRNLEGLGLSERASVMVGEASRLLWKVAGPFDLVFQDGDKTLYGPLLDRLVSLLRPGGLLASDNVLWCGEVVPGLVAAPQKPRETTEAIAAYNERLVRDPRLFTVFVPVGDGLALSVRR
ncbi:MAG: O-methyltransferase [Vicinamibacterales bacterium]